jgi:hypothetical protein
MDRSSPRSMLFVSARMSPPWDRATGLSQKLGAKLTARGRRGTNR